MRRSLIVPVVAVAAGVLVLVGAAMAAHSRVTRLTVTPRATTSDTQAVFSWTTPRGTARTLCRLRWRPLSGKAMHSQARTTRRFSRCHAPATWRHLKAGRYTFTLVVRRHGGPARWLGYSWKVVPESVSSSSSGSTTTTTTTTSTTTTSTTTTGTTTTTPSPPPPPPPPPTPSPPPSTTNCVQSGYTYLWPVYPGVSSAEQQFVNLVNEARQSLGVPQLSLNSSLSLAADSHSYWQDVTFGYSGLTHEPGCHGSTPWQRMSDAGYSASYEGEVTLVSYPAASAQQAFTMFKNSPSHWQLLTSPLFTQIGVGASAYHWTGDLGGP